MSKGMIRSYERGRESIRKIAKKTIDLTGEMFVVIDPIAATGWGTTPLEELPKGNVLIVGAALDISMSASGSGNIDPDFFSIVALGSTATVDNVVTGTDEDIIARVTSPLASGFVTSVKISEASRVIVDNSAGGGFIHLNLQVASNTIIGNDTMTLGGVLYVTYVTLGDE